MRRILIIGAGQAGMQLGLCLQAAGYEVTIMSARTPEEMRGGRITSTQCLFGPSLAIERDHGLNRWEHETPRIMEMNVSVAAPPDQAPPGTKALGFAPAFEGQSVDQRVKMAGWLELFESRGGNVVYHGVMTSDLEGLAELYDLTLIAAGKGELVELFDRDPERSPYDRPMRQLAAMYMHGMTWPPGVDTHQVRINVVPGVGELFYLPGYTTSGACDIWLWEALPGGAMDVWGDKPSPEAFIKRSTELCREYIPWEADAAHAAVPTDPRCTLYGGYVPMVRKPVGSLSATAHVFGMGDVVVLNDPIAGQGANNAAHCAEIYLRHILEHGNRPFDPAWMQETFDAYWDYARHSTHFSNMLLGPPPEHFLQVLGVAAEDPRVAQRFADGYTHPEDFDRWILHPDKTADYLASLT
ncbi:MAG: FAD-binding oxidoreductase [Streptosporangiales bacterium]|nr:FAD-binding oxidoreductase [Streptosporangiales bacterium]